MSAKEYNECVQMLADKIYRFILKNIGNAEDARDIIQGAYEKLWLQKEKVPIDKAKSFLFTVAYRLMIDQTRKRKNHLRLVNDVLYANENFNSSYPGDPDTIEIIEKALARLPLVQRSVILLRDYEGYSYEEIGELTSLSPSQVKVYIFRARTALQNFLTPYYNAKFGS